MSHDFLGLSTREPLNTQCDNPLTLNQRLTDDLKNCMKQLRTYSKKGKDLGSNNACEDTEFDQMQFDEGRKMARVYVWVDDEELKEKRVTELDQLRSFLVNPMLLGYDNSSNSTTRMRIDIAATSNSGLIEPFALPTQINKPKNAESSIRIEDIESCHDNQINIPRYSRVKSNRMKQIESSNIQKKGKVFTIKYLPKPHEQSQQFEQQHQI